MTPAETPTVCEKCGWKFYGTVGDTRVKDPDAFHEADLHRQLAEAKADWKAAALREANAVKEIVSIEAQLEEKDARIRELVEARKWAFAYLNHIQQTEPDRSVWAMEPTPKWSFILELAKAAGARWSGHDWESDEAALARSEKGGNVTPAETPKVGDWCWHIHHEVLIEKLTEPFETRKAYIKACKPEHEVEKRLRLMKPASKKASEAMVVYDKACSEAWAVYDKARSEAWVVYDKAISEAMAVYDKANSEAWVVYDKAISEAWVVYGKAISEARAVYDKAISEARAVYGKANFEAGAVYDKAISEAGAKVEALHQKECPNCPWNGRTIFP